MENIAKAILVGLSLGDEEDFAYEMEEMENLIEACDMHVEAKVSQALDNPNPATYIGKGKLEEIAQLVMFTEAEYVIFSDTLSPAQLKNIQREIDADVLDRTSLILEIFARRAKTREARLQVESANLQYMLPRLVGMGASLSRQGGTSGSMSSRGQGEKKLELDRRHIEKRISELRRELDAIEHDRNVQRKARSKSNTPCVSLVGYTNAGKSTLMNHLVAMTGGSDEKKVFEKDMLFATLDTTVRRIAFEDNKDFLLADTVGFISNLPHGLIKAFRSTLDEVRYADLLLIVVDASDPHRNDQIAVTEETLRELQAQSIPRIYVFNKSDKLDDPEYADFANHLNFAEKDNNKIYISAAADKGVEDLLKMIKDRLYAGNEVLELFIPYADGSMVNKLNEHAHIISQEYEAEGTRIKADCPEWLAGSLFKYIVC